MIFRANFCTCPERCDTPPTPLQCTPTIARTLTTIHTQHIYIVCVHICKKIARVSERQQSAQIQKSYSFRRSSRRRHRAAPPTRASTQYGTNCNLIFMFSSFTPFLLYWSVWYEPVALVCLVCIYAHVCVCVCHGVHSSHCAKLQSFMRVCFACVGARLCCSLRWWVGDVRAGAPAGCAHVPAENHECRCTTYDVRISHRLFVLFLHNMDKLTVALNTLQCRRSRCGR